MNKPVTNSVFKPCVLVPVYNHERAVAVLLEQLLATGLPLLLVDDGSDTPCQQELERLQQIYSELRPGAVQLLRLPRNRGKGGAVKAGLAELARRGYSHALQIDADGQHDVQDVQRFLQAGEQTPQALICGRPLFDQSVPRLRYYARYLTHVWVWINTLSLTIKDSMCGFRLYPLTATLSIINNASIGNRMDFDPEIIVRWVWRGYPVENLATRVSYPIDGVSHFAPWKDNALISAMHTKLFFLMLPRAPGLLLRKLAARRSLRSRS